MTRKTLLLIGAVAILALVATAGRMMLRPDDSAEARVRITVKAFMQARLARDDAKVRTYLASDFHRQYVDQVGASLIGKSDPHYHRFHIDSISPSTNGAWVAQVRIEEQQQGFAPAGWFSETITLVPVNDTFRIGSVTSSAYEAAS